MEPLGSLAETTVASLVRNQPLTPEKVNFAWRLSVGAAIDRATRVRLAGATLVVNGEPQWLKEIERSQALIVRRLQRVLGEDVVRTLSCSSR
jgi:Dna[CI] antecedent, DciA